MIVSLKRSLLIVLVCAFCTLTTKTAKANVGYAPDRKAVPIIVGVVAVGVLIVYFAVHHRHSLKGCTSVGPGGLQIQNEGDRKVYALTDNTGGIKPGNRVRVSGKKIKHSDPRAFDVSKLSKDYGACRTSSGM